MVYIGGTMNTKIYEIIKEVFNINDIRPELDNNYQMILEIIKENKFKTKTELFKFLIHEQKEAYNDIIKENKLNHSTCNIICLIYLKIYFDCILQINNDIIDFLEIASLTNLFGKINEDIHPYLKMMLRINIKLEKEIETLYNNLDENNDTIFLEIADFVEWNLNCYKEDNTNWNKI